MLSCASERRASELTRPHSLPVPSREELQKASPTDAQGGQLIGASSGIIQGGGEAASGALPDSQLMEDPSGALR